MSAIADYVRTALLIDDRFESGSPPLEVLQQHPAESMSSEPVSGLLPPPPQDEEPVYWPALVRAFLADGIVCSVLEATEEVDVETLALRGARISDILILDWLMFAQDETALRTIKAIAREQSDRLTVIAVFTGIQRLSAVVDRLLEDGAFSEESDFVLTCGSVVVLVFGKPGITLLGSERIRTATYEMLPSMIREDLEWLFKGLMPQFAFLGVNQLRDSIPRVLTAFKADLDAAVLTHRALLAEPVEAGYQLVRLLVDEFAQALAHRRISDIWDPDNVRTFLSGSQVVVEPGPLAKRIRDREATPSALKVLDDDDLAKEAIARGLAKVGMTDDAMDRGAADLRGALANDLTADISFATLLSSIPFGEVPPRLEQGVVVEEGGCYWLCIQPLCDSVHLKTERAFPLMPLRVDYRDPVALISDLEGSAIPIGLVANPFKLRMPVFAPTEASAVVAALKDDKTSCWVFRDDDDRCYRAIARLRDEVTTHAVQLFVSKASRPGMDQSELLRRKDRKKRILLWNP